MEIAQKKVLIGMPCGSGSIPAYVVDSLYKMRRPPGVLTSLLIIERQQVDIARNFIIQKAIEANVDYLMFIDDDGILPADTLEKMMEDDKDIVGAPMCKRNEDEQGNHALCVFEGFDVPIGDGKTIKNYRNIKSFDASKGYLHSVDAIGGACMLIKREVLDSLYKAHNGRPFEWKYEQHVTKEVGLSVRNLAEDICFSERAKLQGFEIFIDLRLRPVHLGRPKFIRFEQEGENLPPVRVGFKNAQVVSESLELNHS